MSEQTRLDTLAALLAQSPDEVFIQPHNVPDPDAIAASAGMQYLLGLKGIKTVIVYDRDIEKTDSARMLELFDIDMHLAKDVATLGVEDWALLVDGQKGGGNLTDLPTDEVACIDHHEYRANQGYSFEDIRPSVGACSSIVAEYFFQNHIEPPMKLATALVFGIMKDTEALTRGLSDLDIEMFYQLYRYADPALIKVLNGAQLTRKDLDRYADAFRTVEVYDGLGFMRLDAPDDSLLGAASDIVLSLDTVVVVLAYSVRPEGVKLSVRSEIPDIKANDLVRFVLEGSGFGGGHDHMAGGFLPIGNIPATRVIDTFLRHRAILFVETARGQSPNMMARLNMVEDPSCLLHTLDQILAANKCNLHHL